MSVLDSIDTTITIAWGDTRTIGTLIELGGRLAILTALRTPAEGQEVNIVVEGDTQDENVSIDGTCSSASETAWGEQQIEMRIQRVGTTCSASRLRDFIEQYGILRGGSVHIGKNRDNPTSKRFVYHLPETRQGIFQATGDDFETKRPKRETVPATTKRGIHEREETDLPSPRHMPSFEVTAYLGSNPALEVSEARAAAERRAAQSPSLEIGFDDERPSDTLPNDPIPLDFKTRPESGSFKLDAALATQVDYKLPDGRSDESNNEGLSASLQAALQAIEQPNQDPQAQDESPLRSPATWSPSPQDEITSAFDVVEPPSREPSSDLDAAVPPSNGFSAAFEAFEPPPREPTSAFDAFEAAPKEPTSAFDAFEEPSESSPDVRSNDNLAAHPAMLSSSMNSERLAALESLGASLKMPGVALETEAPAKTVANEDAATAESRELQSQSAGLSRETKTSDLPEELELSRLTEDATRRPTQATVSELNSVFNSVESSEETSDDEAAPWYAGLGDEGQAWAELAEDNEPIEVGSAIALDELDSTKMMDAIGEPKVSKQTAHYGELDLGGLTKDQEKSPGEEVHRAHVNDHLISKIDEAIALERAFADSEHYDPDEPILVNTVDVSVPFADPVQLGHDNQTPSIGDIRTTFRKKSRAASGAHAPTPAPRVMNRRQSTTGDREVILPPTSVSPPRPDSATTQRPISDDRSTALHKIEQVFGVDLAMRCNLPVLFGADRKKRNGNLLRLSESRLRIESEDLPKLYERISVVIPLQDGKTKITLNCEITRIREPEGDEAPITFDMRVASNTSPKQMNILRDLLRSLDKEAGA